jgi:hypothetical protein
MADWKTVRRLALAFPGVEEGTSYGQPALRVGKKLFTWMSPHEQGSLCVRVNPEERELLLDSNPEAYFTTPHYAGHPILLVRFEHIGLEELGERIEDAWLLCAPKRLVDDFVRG